MITFRVARDSVWIYLSISVKFCRTICPKTYLVCYW